jgi:hypothetical protein
LVAAVAVYLTVPVVVVQARELRLILMNIAALAWDVRTLSMHCQFVEIVGVPGKIVKGWGYGLPDQDWIIFEDLDYNWP